MLRQEDLSHPSGSSCHHHNHHTTHTQGSEISCCQSHADLPQAKGMDLMSDSRDGEKPKASLDSLAAELLTLIFEELLESDRISLWAIRLTSKRVAAVAIPILYRTLKLTRALTSPQAADSCPEVRDYIQQFTLRAVITSDLNPTGIRRILEWATRLQTIQWTYVRSIFQTVDTCWLLQDAMHIWKLQDRGVTLEITNLPLHEFTYNEDEALLTRTIPFRVLTSLMLGNPAPPLIGKIGLLKRLLLLSSQLKTLHYQDRGQGTSFDFDPEDGKLPALENLMLRSYDWDHSRSVVAQHWDFSKLKSLQLIHVPTFNFLCSINPNDFRGLHTLRVEDFSAHLPDRRREASAAWSSLVGMFISSLEVLDLVCHVPFISIESLVRHHRTLQVLRLRDHTGFGEEEREVPTLDKQSLERLARTMIVLHTLELDMDLTQSNSGELLNMLCTFRSLHTLTIHVQTLLRPLEAVDKSTDRDYDAAVATFRFLLEKRDMIRRHPKFQNVSWAPWRHITINVGGWRRVMVRRVSSVWRERNQQGIFAERCFVLESTNMQHGRLGVREEIGVESPSRRATPELLP